MPGLVYEWTPARGLNNPEVANPFAAPAVNTNYIVNTRSRGGGCSTTDTVVVRASIIENKLEIVGKAAYCIDNGDSAILKVGAYRGIQWYRNGTPLSGAQQQVYRATSSGLYHAVLVNDDGCNVPTDKLPIVIDKAKPGITYPVEYAIENSPITLKAREIGETVFWRPGINLSTPSSFTPVFTGIGESLYTIEITTNTGCVSVDTQVVKTLKNVELFVPTAFTPNQDGKNDFLRPLVKGIKSFRYFKVFNRWGQLLFESKAPLPGWDGTYKGAPQATQTVVWMLQCVGLDNVEYQKKGTTVLLR